MGFELVNLSEITSHPSPNYLLVLQMAQEKAIAAEAGLLIVESDVIVKKHTLQSLFDGAQARKDCGIAAAVNMRRSIIPIYIQKAKRIKSSRRRSILASAALC